MLDLAIVLKFILPLLIILVFKIFGQPYTEPAPVIVTPSEKIATVAALPRNDNIAWGTTDKIGDHIYRTYVGSDSIMGTPEEILNALNVYRKNHGQGQLQSDQKLCDLAQNRAIAQDKLGTLDSHKGLIEYMNNPDSWNQLGVTGIGENASYGYVLSGVHLIEWVFDSDSEHRENQLNPNWTLACAEVFGKTVDIVFGHR